MTLYIPWEQESCSPADLPRDLDVEDGYKTDGQDKLSLFDSKHVIVTARIFWLISIKLGMVGLA
jgi:hypothetical protein